LELYQLVPIAALIILCAGVLYYLMGYWMIRTKPPTSEPVIGTYSIHFKGQGQIIEGLTTTARFIINEAYITSLKTLDSKIEEMGTALRKLHLYGVRDGLDRVLVISDKTLETAEYADSSRETRYMFPFGPVSPRYVYGHGVIIDSEMLPELFNFFKLDFDKAAVIYPDNLMDGDNEYTADRKTSDIDLAQTVLLLRQAAVKTGLLSAKQEIIEVQDKHIEELGYDLSESVDRALLAENQARRNSPFAIEQLASDFEERQGLLPRMTAFRVLTIVASAAYGWMELHKRSTLTPQGAAIFAGIGLYVFWLIYDRWLKGRL